MKYFFNESLRANNVLTLPIDAKIAKEALAVGNRIYREDVTVTNPSWQSDIRWISPNSTRSFKFFYSIFKRLEFADSVRQFVDCEDNIRMYTGFLVERSHCTDANFHVDWCDTGNEAFTLITPISENYQGFGLLYEKDDGSIGEYEYKLGEAIIFGDHFSHSTKPGQSDSPVVLLSFTFGSDKMKHWPAIEKTAAHQGNMIRLPDGRFQINDINALD